MCFVYLGQADQVPLEGLRVAPGYGEQLLALIDHQEQVAGAWLSGQGVGHCGGGVGRVGVKSLAQLGARLGGRSDHEDRASRRGRRGPRRGAWARGRQGRATIYRCRNCRRRRGSGSWQGPEHLIGI